MSWFLAFAGFAALIILHELGHFLAAKATGMRVERFYLFFPPAVAKFRRGEVPELVQDDQRREAGEGEDPAHGASAS